MPGDTSVPYLSPERSLKPAVFHDAGQFHFQFDGAVQIEVPEEAVFVVPDGGDQGDDQPAGSSGLDIHDHVVGMFPKQAGVLLMHADGIFDYGGRTGGVGYHAVEIMDVTAAIAAELERIGQAANAVLADIEGILAEVTVAWVAVGHDHFSDRGAVEQRPQRVAIAPADVVQDQAFAGIEFDVQMPVRPSHLIAIDAEGRAVGLADVEGFQYLEMLHCSSQTDLYLCGLVLF